jgi:hypothetical protein
MEVKTTLRIDEKLWKLAKHDAVDRDQTLKAWLIDAIEDRLKNGGKIRSKIRSKKGPKKGKNTSTGEDG